MTETRNFARKYRITKSLNTRGRIADLGSNCRNHGFSIIIQFVAPRDRSPPIADNNSQFLDETLIPQSEILPMCESNSWRFPPVFIVNA